MNKAARQIQWTARGNSGDCGLRDRMAWLTALIDVSKMSSRAEQVMAFHGMPIAADHQQRAEAGEDIIGWMNRKLITKPKSWRLRLRKRKNAWARLTGLWNRWVMIIWSLATAKEIDMK